MKFHLFMPPTAGRRHVLEQGMAGAQDDLYQRMLREVGEGARLADDMGVFGLGFTEHRFHIEGFELSTNPFSKSQLYIKGYNSPNFFCG